MTIYYYISIIGSYCFPWPIIYVSILHSHFRGAQKMSATLTRNLRKNNHCWLPPKIVENFYLMIKQTLKTLITLLIGAEGIKVPVSRNSIINGQRCNLEIHKFSCILGLIYLYQIMLYTFGNLIWETFVCLVDCSSFEEKFVLRTSSLKIVSFGANLFYKG